MAAPLTLAAAGAAQKAIQKSENYEIKQVEVNK